MTTGLRGGRKGDMGGSQGLLRVSFEALHSDIDQGVVGAGGLGRGLHWAATQRILGADIKGPIEPAGCSLLS